MTEKLNAYTMTLEELQNLEPFGDLTQKFNGVVIIPTEQEHDSGYQCMKFAFLGKFCEIKAVAGGGSDVVHLNGTGGYGIDFTQAIKTGVTPVIDWSIDCLPKSHCIRLFNSKGVVLNTEILCSSASIYGVSKI